MIVRRDKPLPSPVNKTGITDQTKHDTRLVAVAAYSVSDIAIEY